MILAAGFGTRLLPHTKLRPKPLFPILNQPLLLLTIQRLQRYGFDRIIVNCHHLREQVAESLSGIAGVFLQEEESILGTGGGLRRALDLMNDEPLLVTNGDIYHTVDFGELYTTHLRNNCPATFAMHDYPRFNSVSVAAGRIADFRVRGGEHLKLAFTGISVIDPGILTSIPDGISSCIIDHYQTLLRKGEAFAVYRTDNCYWTDMGTPDDYLALHAGLLNGVIPRWEEFDNDGNGPLFVDKEAQLSENTRLCHWCCIGRAKCVDARLARVVVWDGVQLPVGYCAEDALISATPGTGQEEVRGEKERES